MTADGREHEIEIPAEVAGLRAVLGLPSKPRGTVIFAHGSGSGRLSPRNNAVARSLQDAGLATVLADLLTEAESFDYRFVFDIELLAERLSCCTRWARSRADIGSLPIGYFGASTGAGAALAAAAKLGLDVRAVVSRGGRPDLAGAYLASVEAPTLLIVGGADLRVIELNEQALSALRCPRQLVIVPGATHLFEELGALEQVSRLARDWFARYLT